MDHIDELFLLARAVEAEARKRQWERYAGDWPNPVQLRFARGDERMVVRLEMTGPASTQQGTAP